MPTYVYEGLNTGTRFEVEQRITEAPLKTNPETGEPVKRIIFASAVVFKGSGFYKNDSRAPESSSKSESGGKSDSSKTEAKTDSSKADSSSTKTESGATPAAAPAASKSASAD